jgi:[protein-PII] uridylyltransferase
MHLLRDSSVIAREDALRIDGQRYLPPRQSYREKVLAHAATRLECVTPETTAAEAADTLRTFLKVEDHRLKMAHFAGAPGCEIAALRSFVIDVVVKRAFLHAAPEFGIGGEGYRTRNRCALIAIGGYGRAELAPFSDIDLLFLYSGRHGNKMKPVLQHVLRLLWDARLTVGHSFRTVGDCVTAARSDPHFQTALVKTRLLAGNKALYNSLIEALEKDRRKHTDAFVTTIRRERELRYAKFGAAVLLQEPNIKESAGGLRDYQTALWSAYARLGVRSFDELRGRNIISEDEAKRIKRAHDFLWRVRHSMHFLMRRKMEYLTLDIQANLARQLGYKPGVHLLASEKLMRDYYARARELQTFGEKLLARTSDESNGAHWWRKRPAEIAAEPFLIRGGRLQFDGAPESFSKDPLAIFNAFALAQAARVPFDYRLREMFSRSFVSISPKRWAAPETVDAFIKLLERRGRAGYVLRLMHEAGFLARIIPEFGRISLLVQHDLYHHYTVDEHTLKAAEALDDLHTSADKSRSHLRAVFAEIEDPATLYLSILLHDIGKGRGRGHIARGVKLAERICRRLGLKEAQAGKIVLLVQHHVTMAHLAQRRDLNESRVIADFAARIGTLDALNMLLLLTYADLNAVGPGVWTEWKATLLWDLYRRTRKLMTGEDAPDDEGEKLAHFKEEIAKALASPLPFSEIERHLALLPERYLRISTAETAAIHLRLIEELKSATIACRWLRHGAASTELTICARDRHGLVADVAGTLAAHGIEILSAEVNTREDGIAIDLFMLRQASTRQAIDIHRYAAIEQALRKAVAGELDVAALVERWQVRNAPRRRTPAIPSRRPDLPCVICDNEASQTSTLIEIHALDELGLVHKIASAMLRLGLDIVCARIATERSDALDVFYVTDNDGAKLSEAAMTEVRDALLRELSSPVGSPS